MNPTSQSEPGQDPNVPDVYLQNKSQHQVFVLAKIQHQDLTGPPDSICVLSGSTRTSSGRTLAGRRTRNRIASALKLRQSDFSSLSGWRCLAQSDPPLLLTSPAHCSHLVKVRLGHLFTSQVSPGRLSCHMDSTCLH
uniref:Uncharacterized protein n=1 Tax=Nothobranchius furzeri TaxID=105023 RepID=A0A1A7ZHS3_NOTFU